MVGTRLVVVAAVAHRYWYYGALGYCVGPNPGRLASTQLNRMVWRLSGDNGLTLVTDHQTAVQPFLYLYPGISIAGTFQHRQIVDILN